VVSCFIGAATAEATAEATAVATAEATAVATVAHANVFPNRGACFPIAIRGACFPIDRPMWAIGIMS
jgi:hypothetical protein